MFKIKKILNWEKISKIGQFLSAILVIATILGTIGRFLQNKSGIFLRWFSNILPTIIYFLIGLILLYLIIELWRLRKRITIGFSDNFRKPLKENWDFVGDWSIENGDELSVTESDPGGITKVGSFWENYDFRFQTKIFKDCTTWLIRAQNINDSFMFQLNEDGIITPHRRITIPRIHKKKNEKEYTLTEMVALWQRFDHLAFKIDINMLKNWFEVVIRVNGNRVDIYIKGKNVAHWDNLPLNPAGKVGFRNHGYEHAHFKNVKVVIR